VHVNCGRSGRKLWLDTAKWQHDRYDARSQAPKSHDEIVATYGFDIRTVHDAGSVSSRRLARKSRYTPLFSCSLRTAVTLRGVTF